MTTFHPRSDDLGRRVRIAAPSQPTDAASWADAARVAVATPGCVMPTALNGLAVAPAVPPSGPEEWARLVSDAAALDGAPLSDPGGRTPAAGTVILEPDGRVWVCEPTNRFGGYLRTFPKGTQERGYALAATAAKEAFEETGLLVAIERPLIDVPRSTSVCRYFLARRIGGSPAEMGWESQAVCLVPLSLLEGLVPAGADREVLAGLSSGPFPYDFCETGARTSSNTSNVR